MRGIDLTTGEARSRRVIGEVGASDAVGRATSWLTGPVYFAYESGSCGSSPAATSGASATAVTRRGCPPR